MPKPLSLKGWKKKAWAEFSKYIRCREADFYGITSCITCDYKGHWKEMNAGHYRHGKLDFDETNVNVQCVRCNKWLSGNLGKYSLKLIKKYGMDKVTQLDEKADKTIYEKYNKEQLKEIYEKYRKLNQETHHAE